MTAATALEKARKQAGLSQGQLARRARTQRTAVSAYEHGRKQPSTETLERLLDSAGFELEAHPARVHEAVLINGEPHDVLGFIDGALLINLFDELVLPREVRAAWTPVVKRALAAAA